MFDTVIFDMDGTLLNTLTDLHISTNFALGELGFPLRSFDEVRNFVGNGVEMLIRRALPKNCDDKTVMKCMEIFKKHYAENMYNNTKPYDGIIEVLKALNGIKKAVVSNKFDYAVKKLCKKYFDELIDFSVGQSDDVPPKPDATGILKCINELGAKKSVLVGDSDVDIQTAKNANIPAIAVTWGFRNRNSLTCADYIIDKPEELLKIVKC